MSAVPEHAPTYRHLHGASGLDLCHSHCRAGPRDRVYDEQHRSFAISLVDRGVFNYRNAGGEARLGPGWLMLANDGDAYACSHEHGDGSGDVCIILSFSAETHDELRSVLGHAGRRFDRNALPPLPRVAALLKNCMTAGAEGFALEETALAVLGAVLEACGASPPPDASNGSRLASHQRDRAMAAARHIEARAAEALTLDNLAASVDLSPFHFLRVFRRAIGVTPHQYLLRVRLIRAVALLRDTAVPVTEVGYRAGWTDLSNFVRTFHRAVGCSPRDFRRSRILGRKR